jgi:hypothetical protein
VVASRAEQSKAAALGFEAKQSDGTRCSDGSEVMVGGGVIDIGHPSGLWTAHLQPSSAPWVKLQTNWSF